MNATDPYALTGELVRDPPRNFLGQLRYIGPGFILSASIVGSGELIATTLVGARAGFVLMWFIIFSCIVKVAIQLEFGKHAISSGESTMASLDSLPGPRLGQAGWSVWVWLGLQLSKTMQVGGIVGGVVLALAQLLPMLGSISAAGAVDLSFAGKLSAFVVAASVSLLVYRGYYRIIEKSSLVMIGLFTVLTFLSVIALQSTELAITAGEFLGGLVPRIPDSAVLLIAVGAFGIIGVGGDEILAYNYWLIEKGYAAYTGPRDDSPGWAERARGWIRVMYLDAILSMLAYTLVTVLFYLLGAAVLNRLDLVPDGSALITTLGNMYTQSLGPWARDVFVVGAIVVLYSTLFAALAAWTRMFADAFGRVGIYDFADERLRRRAIAILAWVIPAVWATLFLIMGNPALMVILGGLVTVLILLIVVFAALVFRYRRLDARLRPTPAYDLWLWASSVSIVLIAAFVVYDQIYRPLTGT